MYYETRAMEGEFDDVDFEHDVRLSNFLEFATLVAKGLNVTWAIAGQAFCRNPVGSIRVSNLSCRDSRALKRPRSTSLDEGSSFPQVVNHDAMFGITPLRSWRLCEAHY